MYSGEREETCVKCVEVLTKKGTKGTVTSFCSIRMVWESC